MPFSSSMTFWKSVRDVTVYRDAELAFQNLFLSLNEQVKNDMSWGAGPPWEGRGKVWRRAEGGRTVQ